MKPKPQRKASRRPRTPATETVIKEMAIASLPLRSPEFMCAPAAAQGHFFALVNYSSMANMLGVIPGAQRWSDAHAAVVLGSEGSRPALDVIVQAGLATWRGEDLVVAGRYYNPAVETRYTDMVKSKRAAADARWARERARREAEEGGYHADDQAHNGVTGGHRGQ